jgi:hypothetical protein
VTRARDAKEEDVRSDRRRRALWLGFVGVLWLVRAGTASAQAFVPLPYDEYHPGGDPAPYEIHVPANWAATNYTLISYQHGYNVPSPSSPLPFPPLPIDIGIDETGAPLLDVLLQLGYAVIGSSYSQNGWAVKQGFEDTQALLAYFRASIGRPVDTILAGGSMGSLVSLRLMEDCPSCGDGVVVFGDASGGDSLHFDFVLAMILAWDVAFRDKDGGWDRANWGPFADPHPGLLFCAGEGHNPHGCAPTDPAVKFFTEISDPTNFGRFEFIRRVVGFKSPYFTEARWFEPPGYFFEFLPGLVATEGFSDLKKRIQEDTGAAVRGRVAQNLTHHYTLAQDDYDALAELGLDASTVAGFLDEMNSRRYARDPVAEEYLETYFDPTGTITMPVITIKDIGDPIVPSALDYAYHAAAAEAGDADLLLQLFRAEMNHGGIFTAQLVDALAAMRAWIDTGVPPAAADFQPADPGVGDFVPFTPAPFPYLAGH